MKGTPKPAEKTPANTKAAPNNPPQAQATPVSQKFVTKKPAAEEEFRYHIPESRKEPSMYVEMTKEEKMKMTVKRLEEDKARANQQLALLKKNQVKKKYFVTKKKVYDLTSGYPICVRRIPDKEGYFFGLSNGTVLYFDLKTEKINTAVKGDSPILDLLALAGDKLITIDDFSVIRVYQEYKLVKKVSSMCTFLAGSQHYSKVLVGNEAFLFFINSTNDGVVRLNLEDFSTEAINLGQGKIFQIALHDEKLFGVSEDGYVCCCKMSDMVEQNPDELEADIEGNSIIQQKIENLTNEQLGIGQKQHDEDMMESSIVLDGETQKLYNSGADQAEEQEMGDKPLTGSKASYDRMSRVLAVQVINSFFRTIAASADYVAVVAHDGKGHNVIYVYDHKLVLKAYKYIHLEEQDYSFNLHKYIHRLEIVQRKEGTYIFAVTHKRDYKLFIYKLVNNEITLFKRFKNVHANMITDMKTEDELIVTASKDKKVNFYTLDYKFDLK